MEEQLSLNMSRGHSGRVGNTKVFVVWEWDWIWKCIIGAARSGHCSYPKTSWDIKFNFYNRGLAGIDEGERTPVRNFVRTRKSHALRIP